MLMRFDQLCIFAWTWKALEIQLVTWVESFCETWIKTTLFQIVYFNISGAKEIDIAATLEHIRDQRMGMVKTKVQQIPF